MTTAIETAVATQTHRVYVGATPEAVWDALTNPGTTDRYGYRGRLEYELRPGGAFRGRASEAMVACGSPEVILEGEVLEVDAPRRLVQTWDPLFDEQISAEAATRLTYEIEPAGEGMTRLTVTHELDGAPLTAAMVGGGIPEAGGGWTFVLSDLKTFLETGASLTD